MGSTPLMRSLGVMVLGLDGSTPLAGAIAGSLVRTLLNANQVWLSGDRQLAIDTTESGDTILGSLPTPRPSCHVRRSRHLPKRPPRKRPGWPKTPGIRAIPNAWRWPIRKVAAGATAPNFW